MSQKTKNFIWAGIVLRPCSHCELAKRLTEYCSKGHGRGLSGECKVCSAARQLRAYYGSLEKSRRVRREAVARHRTPKQKFVNALKIVSPCADCGNRFPSVCMDFDHLPEFKKVADIAVMTNGGGYSLAEIKVEIAKCEIVCSNCHRIRTAGRPKARKLL